MFNYNQQHSPCLSAKKKNIPTYKKIQKHFRIFFLSSCFIFFHCGFFYFFILSFYFILEGFFFVLMAHLAFFFFFAMMVVGWAHHCCCCFCVLVQISYIQYINCICIYIYPFFGYCMNAKGNFIISNLLPENYQATEFHYFKCKTNLICIFFLFVIILWVEIVWWHH